MSKCFGGSGLDFPISNFKTMFFKVKAIKSVLEKLMLEINSLQYIQYIRFMGFGV